MVIAMLIDGIDSIFVSAGFILGPCALGPLIAIEMFSKWYIFNIFITSMILGVPLQNVYYIHRIRKHMKSRDSRIRARWIIAAIVLLHALCGFIAMSLA